MFASRFSFFFFFFFRFFSHQSGGYVVRSWRYLIRRKSFGYFFNRNPLNDIDEFSLFACASFPLFYLGKICYDPPKAPLSTPLTGNFRSESLTIGKNNAYGWNSSTYIHISAYLQNVLQRIRMKCFYSVVLMKTNSMNDTHFLCYVWMCWNKHHICSCLFQVTAVVIQIFSL